MPLAPAQSSQANAHSSHDGHVHHVGSAHDHSVPHAHTHSSRSSGTRVDVSPVLVGVGARVLAVLALLGLLWLAIFWAFAGHV